MNLAQTYLGWIFPAVLSSFFFVIALIDLRQRRIPNWAIYPAIIVMVIYDAFSTDRSTTLTLFGGALGLLVFFLAAVLRPGDLGGGDVKLAAFIGLTFGFPQALWALLVGISAGAITAVFLVVTGRQTLRGHIPYAPFLCLGAIIALIYDPMSRLFHLG